VCTRVWLHLAYFKENRRCLANRLAQPNVQIADLGLSLDLQSNRIINTICSLKVNFKLSKLLKIDSDGTIPIQPAQNAVSWQSAFWSLVPLALNSMAQPGGMVCFYPSKYGAALRSSLILCGIDTLFILKEWIFLIIPAGSPLKAANLWAEFRFQDIDERREIEGSFSNLQKNAFFRIVMFVFGALVRDCHNERQLWASTSCRDLFP
jgi:hypothetical protein